MNRIDDQRELALHNVALVADEIVTRQPTIIKAIITCADIAGLEEKQAADACGLDPATWSRFKKGQTHFPQSRLIAFQQRCGNWLPLQWLAGDAGFNLEPRESRLERQLREERDLRERVEAENKLLRDLVQGRAK